MKVLGIINRTSKENLYILEGNSSRYLVKENLPSNLVSRPLIVYGTINIRINEQGIVTFLNPKLILSLDGKELWRAPTKTPATEKPPTESSSSDEDFF